MAFKVDLSKKKINKINNKSKDYFKENNYFRKKVYLNVYLESYLKKQIMDYCKKKKTTPGKLLEDIFYKIDGVI